MSDLTKASASVTHGSTPLAEKPRLGWLRFLLQFGSVVIVYLLVNALFAIPMVLDQMDQAAQGGQSEPPQLDSALTALTTMASMAAALLVVWLWLRREGGWHVAIDLSQPVNWRSTLVWAAIGTLGTFAIFAIGAPLMDAIGLGAPDPSFILDLITQSPALFALWVVGVAIFAAGFGEEILYRGFLMDRLERLSGLRNKAALVLALQALLFGLPHLYQGLGGMVVTATVGLWFGWIRIRLGGKLWAVIIAHAAVDVIMMSLAYAEAHGHLALG